jgi:aspartyl-tRNA synthetase
VAFYRYRYLDLRRPTLQHALRLRADVTRAFRTYVHTKQHHINHQN